MELYHTAHEFLKPELLPKLLTKKLQGIPQFFIVYLTSLLAGC